MFSKAKKNVGKVGIYSRDFYNSKLENFKLKTQNSIISHFWDLVKGTYYTQIPTLPTLFFRPPNFQQKNEIPC